jgi:hypothetical protein
MACATSPGKSDSVRSLAAMTWQRPNIGSRMNREVHVRFWERAEVKFLRATRQLHALPRRSIAVCFTPVSGIVSHASESCQKAAIGIPVI